MGGKHVLRVRSTLSSRVPDRVDREAARQRREFIARERARSNGQTPWRGVRTIDGIPDPDGRIEN